MVLRSAGAGALCAMVLAASPARAEEPDQNPRRNVIHPEETHGIPPGFHEESRVRLGPAITGGVLTFVGSVFLTSGLVTMAEKRNQEESGTSSPPSDDIDGDALFAAWATIFGGLHLAVGIPLLTYGLLDPRTVYVRDQPSEVAVSLRAEPDQVTTSVRVAF
jgi:hypothetical protein